MNHEPKSIVSDKEWTVAKKLHGLALAGRTDQPIKLGERFTLIIMADCCHPMNNNGKTEYAFFAVISENDVPDETGADKIVLHGSFQSDYDATFWIAFHEWRPGPWETALLAT